MTRAYPDTHIELKDVHDGFVVVLRREGVDVTTVWRGWMLDENNEPVPVHSKHTLGFADEDAAKDFFQRYARACEYHGMQKRDSQFSKTNTQDL